MKARVFMSSGSQHVIIPAEYHFRSEQVAIRRDPRSGDVILSEVPNIEEVFAALDATKDEPVLTEADRPKQPLQIRPALDELFSEAPKTTKQQ